MKLISLLRGINVSGHKKIKMADLKALYEYLGFTNVITYIQSGNVIFETENTNTDELVGLIEKAIEQSYQFQVPVIVRTVENLSTIIEDCPFNPVNLEKDGTKIMISFFSKPVSEGKEDLLEPYRHISESITIVGSHAYLHCPSGYGKTKLSNNLLEKKLEIVATTRNWKTLIKLFDLSINSKI